MQSRVLHLKLININVHNPYSEQIKLLKLNRYIPNATRIIPNLLMYICSVVRKTYFCDRTGMKYNKSNNHVFWFTDIVMYLAVASLKNTIGTSRCLGVVTLCEWSNTQLIISNLKSLSFLVQWLFLQTGTNCFFYRNLTPFSILLQGIQFICVHSAPLGFILNG